MKNQIGFKKCRWTLVLDISAIKTKEQASSGKYKSNFLKTPFMLPAASGTTPLKPGPARKVRKGGFNVR